LLCIGRTEDPFECRDRGLPAFGRDDRSPRASRPRFSRPVAANVDSGPHSGQQPLRACELKPCGDLLDRLEAPHAHVDGGARRGTSRELLRPRLERRERVSERAVALARDSRSGPDGEQPALAQLRLSIAT
jgi:hypothetical protein